MGWLQPSSARRDPEIVVGDFWRGRLWPLGEEGEVLGLRLPSWFAQLLQLVAESQLSAPSLVRPHGSVRVLLSSI